MIPLRVSDLKQYAYCPRVVFYQHVMPVGRKETFKMAYGRIEEDRIDRLESRRKLRRYGLSEGKRLFHHTVSSSRLGLSGRIDLLIETSQGRFPVDFKFTTGGPQKNHVFQVCGYALILEELYGGTVTQGFIYLIPDDDAVVFDLKAALKAETLEMLSEIREMIAAERMPPVVENRNKCYDCEYRNYCGDVF